MGRSVGRQRKYESDAARVAAHRARSGKVASTFLLSPEIKSKLDAFMKNEKLGVRDETKSEVVERALENFFRKR